MPKYPEFQEKAREEVMENINTDMSSLQHADLDKLLYTFSFIKESMRVLPVIPTSRRSGTKDCHLGNYFIPKGTALLLWNYSINYDPNVFDHPDEFIPDRFMPGSKSLTSEYVL